MNVSRRQVNVLMNSAVGVVGLNACCCRCFDVIRCLRGSGVRAKEQNNPGTEDKAMRSHFGSPHCATGTAKVESPKPVLNVIALNWMVDASCPFTVAS